jgi:hypothetical protein
MRYGDMITSAKVAPARSNLQLSWAIVKQALERAHWMLAWELTWTLTTCSRCHHFPHYFGVAGNDLQQRFRRA